jgi:hypothetical protein
MTRTHFVRFATLTALLLVLAGACGPQLDPATSCQAALAHMAHCSGQPASALDGAGLSCTAQQAAQADMMLSLSCDQLPGWLDETAKADLDFLSAVVDTLNSLNGGSGGDKGGGSRADGIVVHNETVRADDGYPQFHLWLEAPERGLDDVAAVVYTVQQKISDYQYPSEDHRVLGGESNPAFALSGACRDNLSLYVKVEYVGGGHSWLMGFERGLCLEGQPISSP